MTMPDSLWPATVHHASVDEVNDPNFTVSFVPGARSFVPVLPPTLRSCAIAPALVTFKVTSWPGRTSIVAGVTLNSVSVTSIVIGFAEAAEADREPAGTNNPMTAMMSAVSPNAVDNVHMPALTVPLVFSEAMVISPSESTGGPTSRGANAFAGSRPAVAVIARAWSFISTKKLSPIVNDYMIPGAGVANPGTKSSKRIGDRLCTHRPRRSFWPWRRSMNASSRWRRASSRSLDC